jgi:hypothetical protein
MTRPAPESSSSQRARILRLLIEARGGWVPSPEIAACAQQYNSRVFDLRRLGFRIENCTEEIDGARHSWFRLVPTSSAAPAAAAERADVVSPQTIPPNGNSDPREQLPLFSPKEDLQ